MYFSVYLPVNGLLDRALYKCFIIIITQIVELIYTNLSLI